MMLKKSLSCPLKVTQEANKTKPKNGMFVLDQNTIWREVAAFEFHETAFDKIQSKGWFAGLGQQRMPSAQRVSPFLVWTKKRFHAFPGSCGSPRWLSHVTCNETKSELLSYSLISITLKFTNTFSSTSLHQLLFCQIQMITGSIITP